MVWHGPVVRVWARCSQACGVVVVVVVGGGREDGGRVWWSVGLTGDANIGA